MGTQQQRAETQKQPNWEHKACIATKLHHKPTGQHYLSKLFQENIWFSPLCFIPLSERLRRYKWWNRQNKKLRFWEYLSHDRIAGSWIRKSSLSFLYLLKTHTNQEFAWLVHPFANSYKDTRQFHLQRNQHKTAITSTCLKDALKQANISSWKCNTGF